MKETRKNKQSYFHKNNLVVNKKLLRKYGPGPAVFLANLLSNYFLLKKKNKTKNRWFCLTYEQQTSALGITSKTQIRKFKNIFKDVNILKSKMDGYPAKEHYRINFKKLVFILTGKNLVSSDAETAYLVIQNHSPHILYNIKANNAFINSVSPISETKSSSLKPDEDDLPIKPKLFDRFWAIYPRKAGSRSKAKSKWRTICTRKNKKPPTWGTIKKAIFAQKKSEQWQDPIYIPHPYTWLNQDRWEDDPKLLRRREEKESSKQSEVSLSPRKILFRYFDDDFEQWYLKCFKPALQLVQGDGDDAVKLATNICKLDEWYKSNQHLPKFDRVPKMYSVEASTYDRLYHVPTSFQLQIEFIEWLSDQNWIEDYMPQHFMPTSGVFKKFFKRIQNSKGVNFFTGDSFGQ